MGAVSEHQRRDDEDLPSNVHATLQYASSGQVLGGLHHRDGRGVGPGEPADVDRRRRRRLSRSHPLQRLRSAAWRQPRFRERRQHLPLGPDPPAAEDAGVAGRAQLRPAGDRRRGGPGRVPRHSPCAASGGDGNFVIYAPSVTAASYAQTTAPAGTVMVTPAANTAASIVTIANRTPRTTPGSCRPASAASGTTTVRSPTRSTMRRRRRSRQWRRIRPSTARAVTPSSCSSLGQGQRRQRLSRQPQRRDDREHVPERHGQRHDQARADRRRRCEACGGRRGTAPVDCHQQRRVLSECHHRQRGDGRDQPRRSSSASCARRTSTQASPASSCRSARSSGR